jgi:hypothetical protein
MTPTSIDFAFLLRKEFGQFPLPMLSVSITSGSTGGTLTGITDPYAHIDTGSDFSWLPRTWIESIGLWDQPYDVDERQIATCKETVTEMIGRWWVTLSLNGVKIPHSVPFQCFLERPMTLKYAVLGQDFLLDFALYYNSSRARGWLRSMPAGTIQRMRWRLAGLWFSACMPLHVAVAAANDLDYL